MSSATTAELSWMEEKSVWHWIISLLKQFDEKSIEEKENVAFAVFRRNSIAIDCSSKAILV